jgi:endoglucanase
MGIGINIGNTLDSIGTDTWLAGETGWGNPRITREFIQALKNYGYKTIRLPVTWAENMGPAPDFIITPEWMDRVAEVVNWILDEEMYCIVNLHHDGGESDKSWILNAADDPDGVALQFATVWKQIAGRFSGASDKLIFEAMNEVGFNTLWDRWNPAKNNKDEAYRILKLLNQTFVDTVRGSGAQNASRYLLISGYYTDIDNTCDPLFQMPRDTVADRLILSVHYYTPATFCILDKDESWGKNREDWGNAETAAADRAELAGQFDKLKVNFINKGIPVILGEYGVNTKGKVEAARVRWMSAVTQTCLDNGICPVLWDTGNDIKRGAPYTMSAALAEVWGSVERE